MDETLYHEAVTNQSLSNVYVKPGNRGNTLAAVEIFVHSFDVRAREREAAYDNSKRQRDMLTMKRPVSTKREIVSLDGLTVVASASIVVFVARRMTFRFLRERGWSPRKRSHVPTEYATTKMPKRRASRNSPTMWDASVS